MTRPGAADASARLDLGRRLDRAVAGLEDPATPLVVVDLDAFDANAAELVRRVLVRPGFAGVLAYSLREALWLVRQGLTDDAVMGYPSVDQVALRDLGADPEARARVTLMIDDRDHLDLIESTHPDGGARVAIDIDAGLRLRGLHVGPKRSPLQDPGQVVALAQEAVRRGFSVVGVMTYEGQVAGVPDDVPHERARSLVVRRLKAASIAQLADRRAAIADALHEVTDLEFWNGGGSGSVEATAADPVVTEVAAGSGLLVPGLFDHYRAFAPRPAAFFGVPVVRRPADGVITVAGGGFVASGAAGKDRLPLPWAPPGLRLTGLEGAGEVQTPLTGRATHDLRIGDRVWFRHAKSGELAEHTNHVHLVRGEAVEATVPTYRGQGQAW